MSVARALRLVTSRPELSSTGGEAANGLLAALPRQDYKRLLAELELVPLAYGEVMYQPGERIRHVYFPNDAIVSLLTVVQGKALEVGLVGREGMVGIPVALGAELALVRAVVQGTGSALRMKAAIFHEALERCVPLQREVQRYVYSKLVEARQTAACNRFHDIEERLARWLLMTHDRVRADRLHVTHEFLADMLGVRRSGVTQAASDLQRRRLIDYRRGDVRILDRKGLEAAACGCYRTVKALAAG